MGLGYLAAIVVAGVIASILFGRLAAAKGYPVSKARRYPLVLTGAAVLIGLMLLASVVVLGQMAEGLRGVLGVIFMVGNWFLIAMFLVVLNKAYSNMKLAPDAEGLRQRLMKMQRERKE